MAKSKSIIHGFDADGHHSIFGKKTALEKWNALKIGFQRISPMSVSDILYNASAKKMADLNNIVKYTCSYQAAFDKIISLLKKDSNQIIKSAEMLL